jgi:hypothetical protein
LFWGVSEAPGITGLAAGALFRGEGAGAGVLSVCARAGCRQSANAINETQARVLVTATSAMLHVGRSIHDHGCQYAMPHRSIPVVTSPTIDRIIDKTKTLTTRRLDG